MKWLIGCSGFSYRDWKPVFYPDGLPASKWLEFYSRHFNTLESNTTFYQTPRITTLQKWFAGTPDSFVFSVKAPRLITHYKKMKGTQEILTSFYDLMLNGLQHKLGCILFQFPPSFSNSDERLDLITSQLDSSFTNIVEFRHQSWWNASVYDTLAQKKIIFCSQSYPGLPDAVIATSPYVYFRFHGVPELYRSSYTDTYMDTVFEKIKQLPDVRAAYLYFNNTIAATAINNAVYLQKQSAGITV